MNDSLTEETIQITLRSNSLLNVPGLLRYARVAHRTGDPAIALKLMQALTNNTIHDAALLQLLNATIPVGIGSGLLPEDSHIQFEIPKSYFLGETTSHET